MSERRKHIWPILFMMAVFAVTRWPGLMPPNFSAAYALAFCAGVYFPGSMAWWLPLGTMLVTDIAINVFYYQASPVGAYMLVNYACFAGLIGLGRLLSSKSSWVSLLGGGLLGAILFYLVTNTASWLQNPLYAKTLAGWIKALSTGVDGLPHTWQFFRNTLMSGGLFTGLFVAAMKWREAPEEEAEEETAGDEAEGSQPEESKA